VIDSFDIFQPINADQIVSGKVNPARAKDTLAPGPEALPTTQIHPMRTAEGEAFEAGKDSEFLGSR